MVRHAHGVLVSLENGISHGVKNFLKLPILTRWEGGKFKTNFLISILATKIRKFLLIEIRKFVLNLPPSQRVRMGNFRKFLTP